MATRKSSAPEPSKSRALAPWQQEMADAAAKQAKAEKSLGGYKAISFRSGILSVDDAAVPGNEMDVVVLLTVHENQWFDRDYDPNKPISPACYSFGDLDADDPEDGMVPHEESESPQNDDCASCPMNVMGSAERGKGKACKNVRRLFVATADCLESAEALQEAEVRMAKLPVTSVKNWATYVRGKLSEELQRPYWGVVTNIKVVPDAKSQFKVLFSFKELIDFDDGIYAALKSKMQEVRGSAINPYPKPSELEAAAPVRPQGRMAEAMQRRGAPAKPAAKTAPAKPAAKAAATPARKSKY